MHGQIQDARERRAVAERTLGSALYQVGADRPQVQAAMQQVTQFAAANRMDSGEIASALAGAQGQFSNLDGPGALSGRVGQALQTALLARNTGNDVGQFLRLQGLLAQQQMDPDQQRQMLLFAAGAAQHGAVELGDLTAQALPAITQRMSSAVAGLGANATPAQRMAAQRAAFVQSISELEVAKGFGNNAGQAGNALASVTTALQGDAVQQRMLGNIRNSTSLNAAQRRSLENELFEDDPARRGHRRLRTTNALEIAERFAHGAGNDPTLFANMFAGGGHGNPRALQANWRQIMGVMIGQDARGRSGADRMRALMDVGSTSLGEQDVARGSRVFGDDSMAQLIGDREAHDNALTANTSALVTLSNAFASWSTRNPTLSTAVGVAAGAVAPNAVGALGGVLGRRLGGAAAASAAGLGTAAAGVGAALAGGLVVGDQVQRRFQNTRAAGADSVFSAQTWRVIGNSLAEGFSDLLRSRPPTLQVSPHAAAHAASVSATANGGRR
jgi:hypothetical protein